MEPFVHRLRVTNMSGLNIIPFRGRTSSFESLVGPHFNALYRLAYRLCGSRDDAEDLVQELLVRLCPKFSELKTIESLRPWLARALYNLFIDTHRASRRSPLGHNVHAADEVIEFTHSRDPGPATAAEQLLRTESIQAALEQMSEAHRSLLVFHDMEGYTLPELAEILELPLGTLKSRLHRAREQLRVLLGVEPLTRSQRVNS